LTLRKSDEGINRFVFAHCPVFVRRDKEGAMQGSLGEKIGEGASAEVHAWAPGQVVKLFRSASSRRLAWHEAHMTDAIFAAGGPAPQVFGVVILEGRLGIVLQRFDGPTLLQLTRSGAITRGQAGAILADLCRAVHRTPPPPGVPALRGWMDAWLRSAGGTLPAPIEPGIIALIERLQPADELCHGDLHPGNVIMTAEGPRLVDWTGTVRAPAAYDLGISHILLTELAPEIADDPERPRAVNAAVQSEYARLAGLSPGALAAAIEPYLPIVRVLVVLGGAMPALRERLLQRVEAALDQPALNQPVAGSP
jgi:serine/threonine protein kinase